MKANEKTVNYLRVVLLLPLFLAAVSVAAQSKSAPVNSKVDQKPVEEENLNVFQDWIRWNNPGSLRSNHLIKQAFDYFDARDREIEKLHTRSDWQVRQEKMKALLLEVGGPFPEKGPLNPKVTGVVQKQGYRIEKIVFESWPGFYVPGCLFIPDKIKGKAPAVLNVIGHEQESYHAALDQVIIQNLVKKGMIVFAIDPLGQGEHVQHFDPKINFSSAGYSVIEHCYFGNLCFLTGSSGAKYFTWDGIRAIDYLVSRKDVDPERIGVTGFSGGGTVTSYVAAFDPRVKVSIPSSWSNSCRRVIEMKGTQDAETMFVHDLKKGITYEDLLEVRAPKPTLLTFTSRDEYLTLQGAREAFQEAKKEYVALGNGDNMAMVEDDSKHWVTPKIRLAMYSFFMKHFGLTGDPSEVEAEILSDKELMVTPTGQIVTSFGGDMVFDVNKKESVKLMENLEKSRKDRASHLDRVKGKAIEISGFVAPCCAKGEPIINGRYQRDGYAVTKYALQGEGDYAVPILLFAPNDNVEKHPALVYLHSEGKVTEAKPGGEIEKLVKKGYIVAAADVLGVGETRNTATRPLADGYLAIMIGRSLVGIQAGDIVRVVNYLKNRLDVDSLKVGAVGINEMGIPLLHAAAFDPSIRGIALVGSLISYRSVVMNPGYKIGLTVREGGTYWHPYEVDFSWGIAGVLKGYDLPDLIGCIAPRRVVLAGLKDQKLEPASEALINQELEFPRSVYAFKKNPGDLRVVSAKEDMGLLVDWCFQ